MATDFSAFEQDQAVLDAETRRRFERVPAMNMEEVELVSSSGQIASVWLGDESRGGMGVLVLGAAVGTVDWIQEGVTVEVRHGNSKRKAIVRHCTLDSPTVLFIGVEWVNAKGKPTARGRRTLK
jgi:hypothetical protein